MGEMLGYIFGGLKYSEKELKKINRILKNQRGLNNHFLIFTLATTVYLVIQDSKIKELTKEIRELKHPEGV